MEYKVVNNKSGIYETATNKEVWESMCCVLGKWKDGTCTMPETTFTQFGNAAYYFLHGNSEFLIADGRLAYYFSTNTQLLDQTNAFDYKDEEGEEVHGRYESVVLEVGTSLDANKRLREKNKKPQIRYKNLLNLQIGKVSTSYQLQDCDDILHHCSDTGTFLLPVGDGDNEIDLPSLAKEVAALAYADKKVLWKHKDNKGEDKLVFKEVNHNYHFREKQFPNMQECLECLGMSKESATQKSQLLLHCFVTSGLNLMKTEDQDVCGCGKLLQCPNLTSTLFPMELQNNGYLRGTWKCLTLTMDFRTL